MQIQIDLPLSSVFIEDEQTYKVAHSFLRQLELAVHHAQKSLEQMKEMNEESGEDNDYTVAIRVTDVEYYDDSATLKTGNPATAFIEIYSS